MKTPESTSKKAARAQDLLAVLLAYFTARRAFLSAEIDAAPCGNESDERRLADLRSRLDELDRLVANI